MPEPSLKMYRGGEAVRGEYLLGGC